MNARSFNWIWHIRGSLPLPPGQSREDAFNRLDPLFRQQGTSHERLSGTLTFRKKDQAAQDKMSVFDTGVLNVVQSDTGLVLRYNLVSRALLFCFLAPLLFLAFAQLTIVIGRYEQPTAAAAKKDDQDKKKADVPMNPIDKFLGAPAPDKPKDGDKDKPKDSKYSPTSSYVFAGIFAVLYIAGRILESRLINRLFRRRLYEGLGGVTGPDPRTI